MPEHPHISSSASLVQRRSNALSLPMHRQGIRLPENRLNQQTDGLGGCAGQLHSNFTLSLDRIMLPA